MVECSDIEAEVGDKEEYIYKFRAIFKKKAGTEKLACFPYISQSNEAYPMTKYLIKLAPAFGSLVSPHSCVRHQNKMLQQHFGLS